MFSLKSKKTLLSGALTFFALFGLTGCLDEKPLPTNELITIYNSELQKTNRMHPLDTMYAQIGGLKEESRYEIRVLDSDKNLITSSQVYTNDKGVIEPTAIWYDIGVSKPTADNPSFHINKDAKFKVNSFIINVKDMYNNGKDTDFEQAFFYVPSKDATHGEYPKPVIFASTSDGEIENAFEETGSKTIDGDDSNLTKIHLRADTLPEKDYLTGNAVTNVDVYVVPFTGQLLDNTTIADLNPVVTKNSVNISDLKSTTGVLIWDLNTNPTLVNPDTENNSYSIIIDLNKDGKYTVGTDLDNDGLTDRYVDAVDGGNVPGFIVKNTASNEFSYYLSDSLGNKVSSVPENVVTSGSIYLNIDNLSTTSASLDVEIKKADNTVLVNTTSEIITPTVNDKVRYLKYVEKAKIFKVSENFTDNITTNEVLTVTVKDGATTILTTNITVYPVETTTSTHSSTDTTTKTTTFDETGTVGGNTKIYIKFGEALNTTGNVYLFENKTWTNAEAITNALASKTSLNMSNNNVELVFDFDDGVTVKNPSSNGGLYNLVLDVNANGTYDAASDKILKITIRDSITNDIPNVGYINIASSGYFKFDNHYKDSQNISMYGYIDEFKKDGSNTKYYPSRGVKAIWNPYIKNKKRYNTRWYNPRGGDVNTYIDYNGEEQASPFNFDQTVNIYIIDADKYTLKANMTLEEKDVRGYGSVHTVQYSCSNGARQQTIWRAPLTLGKYYVIIDIDKDGKITEGVDYIDAVDQTGKTIKQDSSVVGFSVVN